MPDSWVEVFRSREASLASDRSLMLLAVGIAPLMMQVEGGFAVLVDPGDAARAATELHRYATESLPSPPPPAPPPLAPGALASSSIALCGLLGIAGASTRHWLGRDWYADGVLDGAAVRAGAWWRAVTALTLHADMAHLAGNAGFGFVFGAACAALYGPGLGWLLVLLCAALANLAEAAWLPEGMTSLGASTAVFASLGLVTARGRNAAHGRGLARGLYGALIAGALLLALLGTGDAHTDVLGHALGFTIGLGTGLVLRGRALLATTRDAALGLVSVGLVAACWSLALAAG